MTVASLWSVLDSAGCGKEVGSREIVDPSQMTTAKTARINPWNYNETSVQPEINRENRQTLAVDLSIWICEALTSPIMAENHAEPVLHLVYTRTVKLLSLGLKLVFVIEGKRRIRRSPGEEDKFRKRRSGTAFWKACQSCEGMLKILGVHVVRAKAEGEALCAILNQRGIVDGVISKDGDCLLFGAKVVYTRFSIENLSNSKVMRYDAADLHAIVYDEKDDSDQPLKGRHETSHDVGNENNETFSLSREDLIAFALLTGSDMAGDGLPNVGHKKAIRFIRKCQLNFPLSSTAAAIDELKSWARTATVLADQSYPSETAMEAISTRCCSICRHTGDKRSHEKDGCKLCGTQPGEPCFSVSGADKFRKFLRTKALAMRPTFAPVMVMDAYMRPNDNQIPVALAALSSRTLFMHRPRLGDMLYSSFLVKGHSMATSREFVKQTLARLLVRTALFTDDDNGRKNTVGNKTTSLSKEKPTPLMITKRLVREQTPCYEIKWSVNATITDAEGEAVDGYEFITIESQTLVKKRYPELIKQFLKAEQETKKQGGAEVSRRKHFLEHFLTNVAKQSVFKKNSTENQKRGARAAKRRAGFFGNIRTKNIPKLGKPQAASKQQGGDDVHHLMLSMAKNETSEIADKFDYSSMEEGSLASELDEGPQAMQFEFAGSLNDAISRVDATPAGKSTFAILSPDYQHVQMLTKANDRSVRGNEHKKNCGATGVRRCEVEKKSIGFFEKKHAHEVPVQKENYIKKVEHEGDDMQKLTISISNSCATKNSDEFDNISFQGGSPKNDDDEESRVMESYSQEYQHESQSCTRMSLSATSQHSSFPVLSPSRRHVVCDMGIPIAVTPLVSSARFYCQEERFVVQPFKRTTTS